MLHIAVVIFVRHDLCEAHFDSHGERAFSLPQWAGDLRLRESVEVPICMCLFRPGRISMLGGGTRADRRQHIRLGRAVAWRHEHDR